MRNRVRGNSVIVVSILILLVIITGGCRPMQPPGGAQGTNPAQPSFVTHRELYSLLAAAEQAETSADKQTGRIVAAVSPHHLTAGRMIAGVVARLAKQQPGVIIIVGPNHENAGAKVITGRYDWQTPEGPVPAEQAIVDGLLTRGAAARDEDVLSREHAVGSLVPFIRHYLPEAKIVPLILQHGVTAEQTDTLLDVLEPYLTEDAVLLASVDFSHYLTRRQAYDRDIVTLEAMRAFDYTTLFRLNSEYLDSPASLALVFKAAQRAGAQGFTLLEHGNSGDILHNELIETTSYFTLILAAQ